MIKVELTGEYHADCNMLMARIEKAEAERDRFRTVLESAEYQDIEKIASMPIEHCRALGEMVAEMTKALIRQSEVQS